ncbi:uncharacterized protein LOC126017560 [Suncus etruscus]|uniref:uncharacterized protein LOC126017560 n=1 Tax=Suncus etruscus TaxID=109475 RepID=UPI002110893B|nr:uncharacterized protein LOC126017560 [Suncus etruscus]
MLLLFWGSLLCWGLLPQAQGRAQHQLYLMISKKQFEADISDLFEHRVLERLTNIPLAGTGDNSVAILDDLPLVKKRLSKEKNGLFLSLGSLMSKESLLGEVLQTSGLVIEDSKGLEVSVELLTDTVIQVTLRNKLYIKLPKVLRLEVIKNIRIGARLDQKGNKTKVVFEECHTPPGYLSIKVLEELNPLLANKALLLVTSLLDEALPFLLQKIVCPEAEILLNLLLEDLLHLTLPPMYKGPENFQYHVTTTEFTEDAILMHVLLITPCGSGQRPPKHQDSKPLPKLDQDSIADLIFQLETYNDILFCLYTSKEIYVDPQDSTFTELTQMLLQRDTEVGPQVTEPSSEAIKLVLRSPQPPRVHLDGQTATVTQSGSLVLILPSNNSDVTILWNLSAEAEFPQIIHEKLILQMNPESASLTLVHYPPDLLEKKKKLVATVLEILKRVFMPYFNELLKTQGLPMPNIKGLSFGEAQRKFSQPSLAGSSPADSPQGCLALLQLTYRPVRTAPPGAGRDTVHLLHRHNLSCRSFLSGGEVKYRKESRDSRLPNDDCSRDVASKAVPPPAHKQLPELCESICFLLCLMKYENKDEDLFMQWPIKWDKAFPPIVPSQTGAGKTSPFTPNSHQRARFCSDPDPALYQVFLAGLLTDASLETKNPSLTDETDWAEQKKPWQWVEIWTLEMIWGLESPSSDIATRMLTLGATVLTLAFLAGVIEPQSVLNNLPVNQPPVDTVVAALDPPHNVPVTKPSSPTGQPPKGHPAGSARGKCPVMASYLLSAEKLQEWHLGEWERSSQPAQMQTGPQSSMKGFSSHDLDLREYQDGGTELPPSFELTLACTAYSAD